MNKAMLIISVFISIFNVNLLAAQVFGLSEQGRRQTQEDEIILNDNRLQDCSFNAVFDGHGGDAVGKWLRLNFFQKLIESGFNSGMTDEQISAALKSEFLQINNEILQKQEAFKIAYANSSAFALNYATPKINVSDGTALNSDAGSTGLVSFVLNAGENVKKLVVANVGDCRAVLSKNGCAVQITKDHKASDPDEAARVRGLGGDIFCRRVSGILAVSRAFGDHSCKDYIIPEPDVCICQIKQEDDFLIMASDGLWDVIDSQFAVNIVKSVIDIGSSLEMACQSLIDYATHYGSMDNISVIIINFKN